MILIHKPTFLKQLKHILEYISNDKLSASLKFKNELKENINLLPDNPFQYKQSKYFKNINIREMTFKKYTVVYRVKPSKNKIEILRIFNRNKPS